MGDSFSDSINDAIHGAMKEVHAALEGIDVSDAGMGDPDVGPGEPLERQFDVGPEAELSVSNVSGEISIRAEEGSTIRVRATKRGSPSRAANTQINFSQEGNRVTVGTRGGGAGLLSLARGVGSVDYRIIVPPDCSLRVNTVSGEVDIEGVGRGATVESVSGDIRLRNVRGDFAATTVSGDLKARDLAGTLLVRTTSGDTEAEGSRLRRFNLNSVSGDFSVETPLAVGEHYFAKTVSGDLRLRVPPSTGATIELRTTSGDVNCQLPAEIIKAGRRHWQGRVNGGGATVEMNSVSGDLTLSRGVEPAEGDDPSEPARPMMAIEQAPDPAPPAERASASPADPHESQSTVILRLLEQGEITVEEAMERLDALG